MVNFSNRCAVGTGTANAGGVPYNKPFNKPAGITIDAAGNLYVADSNNNTLNKYTPPAKSTSTVGGALGAANVKTLANTDFKLGNVYSYPNPAKNGQNPTLHIEVGQADTVEIKIFNIAAELVHTAALLNTPLTDKNSDGILEYEYAWPGTNDSGQTVASGVYIYYIEARKSGYSPITVIKKAVIIR